MDWIEKITGVIASLLSSQVTERCLSGSPMGSSHHRSASDSSSFESSDFDHNNTAVEEFHTSERPSYPNPGHLSRISHQLQPEPMSHYVRSSNLDVKVWEPSVIELFQNLGNTYCNSIWENLLQIYRWYVEKRLVSEQETSTSTPYAIRIWEAVKSNNIREVYRLILHQKQTSSTLHMMRLLVLICFTIHMNMTLSKVLNLVMLELLLQFGADTNRWQDPTSPLYLLWKHKCLRKSYGDEGNY
ncbi:hypothetical protein R6Q57_020201 [Mikania cordata]